jgi:hypothetical protein
MGEASADLMKLRPVTFYYKPAYDDGSHLRQYGLIAEEVAKLYPDLVQYDRDGLPLAVRYHAVNAMLLNEVQKQQRSLAAGAHHGARGGRRGAAEPGRGAAARARAAAGAHRGARVGPARPQPGVAAAAVRMALRPGAQSRRIRYSSRSKA